MNLSPHFTLAEYLTTGHNGVPNEPDTEAIRRMSIHAHAFMERDRSILGVPLRVNSGYRSAALNKAIGGASKSQHMAGEAADFVPVGVSAEDAMARLVQAGKDGLIVYDQLIIYASGFIHGSYAADRENRMQALRSTANGGSGGPYLPYTGKTP